MRLLRPFGPRNDSPWLLLGMGVSGVTAMIYEVGWTRVLATVLGSSTYAFTLMLATFLLGIALGSAGAERVLRRRPARWSDWAGLQMTISFFSLITLPLFDRLGIVTVRLFALTLGHPVWLEAARFGVCSALMIVPTFCFGALFPISISLYSQDPSTVGRKVGTLYLANTLGNILGSLSAGFWLIPTVGIYQSIRLAVAAGGLAGLVAGLEGRRSSRRLGAVCAAAVFLVGGLWTLRGGWNQRLLTSGLHVKPWSVIDLDSNRIRALLNDWEVLFYREGLNSIVSVEQYEHRALRVNGKVDASSGRDMETQVLSAHLPHLLHPHPSRSLVIGFGSGTTLRCCFAHPTVARADCVEIEPAVIEAAPYFDSINHGIIQDPRVRVILNDGRNHLLVEQGTYDCIVSEPSNPWMAGVASLFTVEFYQLARKRLAPDGIFCQWIQGYALDPSDFAMVIRSVKKVFPHVTLWRTLPFDFLIIAGDKPIVFDLDRIQERINRSPELQRDLFGFGIHGAAGLLALFQLGETDLGRFVRAGVLNTDNQLLLEFNAPWSMYKETDPFIRKTISSLRTEPFPPIATKGLPIPDNPDLLDQIGEAYLAKGEFDAAGDVFKKALEINPRCLAAQVGLGRATLGKDQILKAIPLFEEAIRQDPKSPYAYGNLGVARWEAGDASGGLEALKKAGQLDEKDWDTFFRIGTFLEDMRQWPEAAEVYRHALSLKPDDLQIQIRYAHCLTESGQPEKAIPLLEKLRGKYKTHLSIADELTAAYQKFGDIPRAIAVREEMVRLNPFRPENWAALAALYNRQGNRQKTMEALARRRALSPF